MIEIMGSEDKSILVLKCGEINTDSHLVESISKPQLIHMYAYDIHLLSSKINIETLLYYIDRFEIDFLAFSIQLTKNIKTGQSIIAQLKKKKSKVFVILTGEAITPEIAGDIGADGYTLRGDDIIRVMEFIENKHKQPAIGDPRVNQF